MLKAVDYEGLRREQAARSGAGEARELMGIGVCTFTEIVGAGPTKVCDILGIGLFDSCEIRVHPTGSAHRPPRHHVARARATRPPTPRSSPPSWASRPSDIQIEEGDTDKAPYGAGT